MQNDWRRDEPIESSLGFGTALELPLFSVGRLHVGLEAGVDALFREGDVLLPLELGLKAAFDRGAKIQPYLGLAPVVSLDGVAIGSGEPGPVWQRVNALLQEFKRDLKAA